MFKKNYIFLLIALFSTIACSEEIEDTQDFNEVFERSEDKEGKNGDELEAIYDIYIPEKLKNYLDSLNINADDIKIVDTMTFTDRFGADSTYKISWENDKSSYYYWHYRDSTRAKNAMYNWLDCFGEKCKHIKVNESLNFQKEFTSIWLGEKEMHYFSSKENIGLKELERILDEADKTWKYIMIQNKNSRAKWYVYDLTEDRKLTLITDSQ